MVRRKFTVTRLKKADLSPRRGPTTKEKLRVLKELKKKKKRGILANIGRKISRKIKAGGRAAPRRVTKVVKVKGLTRAQAEAIIRRRLGQTPEQRQRARQAFFTPSEEFEEKKRELREKISFLKRGRL